MCFETRRVRTRDFTVNKKGGFRKQQNETKWINLVQYTVLSTLCLCLKKWLKVSEKFSKPPPIEKFSKAHEAKNQQPCLRKQFCKLKSARKVVLVLFSPPPIFFEDVSRVGTVQCVMASLSKQSVETFRRQKSKKFICNKLRSIVIQVKNSLKFCQEVKINITITFSVTKIQIQ